MKRRRFAAACIFAGIFIVLAIGGERFLSPPKSAPHFAVQWMSQVKDGLIGPACGSSSCQSASNACGMTNPGHFLPDGSCDATVPADTLCSAPPRDCNAVNPQCLVSTPSAPVLPGQTVTLAWNCPANRYASSQGSGFSTGGALTGSVQVTPQQSTNYSVRCTTSSGSASNGSVAVTVDQPSLLIVSSASRAQSGKQVTITWSAANVTNNSCRVTANALPISWAGDSGSQRATITAQTIFTLSCSVPAGPITRSVTVNLVPQFIEQ